MSQKERIYNYLLKGYSLTPVEALDLFGSFRLSQRIRELEIEGIVIERDWYLTQGGARVRRYRMAS